MYTSHIIDLVFAALSCVWAFFMYKQGRLAEREHTDRRIAEAEAAIKARTMPFDVEFDLRRQIARARTDYGALLGAVQRLGYAVRVNPRGPTELVPKRAPYEREAPTPRVTFQVKGPLRPGVHVIRAEHAETLPGDGGVRVTFVPYQR